MTGKKRSTPFYFGGAASCVAAVVVHPFDLTKVRLQNTKGACSQGMFSTMIKIARTEGVLQLYAGLSASILRQATYSTVRFGGYEKLKQHIGQGKDLSLLQLLFCSSTAGAIGGACGNPADVVNVRMQSDGQLPPQQRRNYKHALDGVLRIAREEGLPALFRGVGPNVNRAILMTSSQCVSYDTFKDLLLRYSPLQDGLALHFSSSTLAVSASFFFPSSQPYSFIFSFQGLVATTVCSPVDVIKTRIMTASTPGASSLQIMASMYRSEGLASFFKGWTPAFIRLAPQTIITFVVLEQFKKWHTSWHDQNDKQLVLAKI
ncbi:mitochondrial carrier [Hesseltinella vesiculosa]|uniref:Mitochondrial carrier n=1 Tax=Hesseltinella vesiculosa TaxID=101127 RepID=A0A1X2GTV7_9FUNG|nr:mitochondrial carrier [Hesseltinella vesiculosa]